MTATAQPSPTTAHRSQLWPTTRYLLREALSPLLWTALTMAALAAIVAAAGLALGWEYEVVDEGVFIGVEATRDVVTVQGAAGPAAMALLQVTFALSVVAVVMAAVVPARHTRVLLSSGVTRRSLTIGLLLALLAVVAVVAVAVLGLVGLGGLDGLRPGGAGSTDEAWASASGWLLQLGVMVLTVAAITAVFLRWPWWVGVGCCLVGGWLLMMLGLMFPSFTGLWWWTAIGALVAAVALVLVLRRVPTR